jgi:endonuclease G, mitochondrial
LSALGLISQSELQQEQQQAAAARVAERTTEREGHIATLREPGGIGCADEARRVAARLDRLSRHWARAPRPRQREESPQGPTEEVLASAIGRGDAWTEEPPDGVGLKEAGRVLERIIGTPDFVGINYLETGVRSAHAVGRVNIRDGSGKVVGYGTGSLVAPNVLLTNHHVLSDAATAATSVIEFDFEDGPDGQPRQSRNFAFAPDALFIADEALDFAVVAVDPAATALTGYGFNPLIEAEGKAIIGEFVTIVQHPRGERKQVALRDNRIVDVVEEMLHYEADTEPGSSGSLVFNDQWETVALHHASVPREGQEGGVINEGIRISRVIGYLREVAAREPNQLLAPVLEPGTSRPAPIAVATAATASGNGVAPEAIEIDPDYSNREGYDPSFLGGGERSVPLPELSEDLAADAALRTDAEDAGNVLPYHHFSLVMSKSRKLAIYTAVNIDGNRPKTNREDDDRWAFDPRLPREAQTGEPVYADNDLDRGHLVRRLDPAWGEGGVAKAASDDTFHFTNCAPQHADFNRNASLWAGAENVILNHATNEKFKVSVFTGPVFTDEDEEYRGVKLPRQFWKVVVMAKSPGLLSATGLLLSQESLIDGFERAVKEEFSLGAFSTFQVQVSEIERLTGLSFGELSKFDQLGGQESTRAVPRKIVHERSLIF